MILKTWSQTPSLKAALDRILETATPLKKTPCWRVFAHEVEGYPNSLIVHWPAHHSHGALHAEGVNSLIRFFTGDFPNLQAKIPVDTVFLVLASAGADVKHPFDSLVAINHLLETLLALRKNHSLTLYGALLEPPGTYGGASLLLAATCQTIWCHSPSSLHLVGEAQPS